MKVGVLAKGLQFKDGTELPLAPGSIVVFTGPNNSGKSTVLREVHRFFDRVHRVGSLQGRILDNLVMDYVGTPDEFVEYFNQAGFFDEKKSKFVFSEGYGSGEYIEATIRKQLDSGSLSEAITSTFAIRLTASGRLASEGYSDKGVDNAAAILFDDEDLEIKVSDVFRRAFGKDLILNRAPKRLGFHIGSRSEMLPHGQRHSKEFRKWIDAQATVSSQGDGIRAYARILRQLMVLGRSVVIIDEPELFLHPPQVRQLAKAICNQRSENSQVFISTHSDELVKGLLDTDHKKVSFARLETKGDLTKVSVLDSSTLEAFWSDPLLRTTNALSSLFYDFTILCEGETDVRFFQSLMERLYGEELGLDFFFMSCGGKSKIGHISRALSAIGVPNAIVADFDIFNDTSSLMRIIESVGSLESSSKLRSGIERIRREVEANRAAVDGHYFKGEVDRILRAYVPKGPVDSSIIRDIKAVITSSSPWQALKLNGVDAISNSTTRAFAGRLIDELDSLGIFIHRVGVLESYCKSIATSSKSGWLEGVLQYDMRNAPELRDAREYLNRIVEFARSSRGGV